MTPDRPTQLTERDVFTTTRGLTTSADRAVYLAQVAVENPALADRVRQLLVAADAPHALLDGPLSLPFNRDVPASACETPRISAGEGDAAYAGSADGRRSTTDLPRVQVPGFEIEAVLGRGGTSVVYKAQQTALKRTIALKMMLAGGHASPDQRARFRIEAEAVARLQHPNIVQIHEVGESGGYPYCVLEYVAGGTLEEQLNGRPMPAAAAARLVETLARAMHLAHSRNVVHRDLKPANIMMTPDGVPKITDFGLARQLDGETAATHTGMVMGTPSYMAPEQATGHAHQAGPAADVYALGAILYTCLTGQAPFTGGTLTQILDRVVSAEPAPPSRLAAAVPIDVDTICLTCLRKEPELRYASALELADELARFRTGEPIRARPVGRVERTIKWVTRNPRVAAALAVVAVVLLGVTVASVVVADQFRDMAQRQTDLTEKEKASRLAAEQARDGSRRDLYHAETTLAVRLLGSPGSVDRLKAHCDRWADQPDTADLFGWEWGLTGQLAQPIASSSYVRHGGRAIAFSPDGRTLAVGEEGLVLFDADTMRVRAEWDCGASINALQWEPAGERMAVSSPDRVALVDLRTGSVLWQRPAFANPRMVWHPRSHWVAYHDAEHNCRIADVKTGESLHTLSGLDEGFAVSPDGAHLATAVTLADSTRWLRIWRTSDWTLEKTVPTGRFAIPAVAWSPDGRQLAVGNTVGEVLIVDPTTGTRTQTLEANGVACNELTWRPDGLWFAVNHGDGSLRVWECATWAEMPLSRGANPYVTALRWHPNGTDLITGCGDHYLRSWPIDRRQAYWTFHFGTRLVNTSYLTCQWHPDGASLAGSGAAPGTIVWGVDGRRRHRLNAVEWQWTADGAYAASVFRESVTVWDADGRTVAEVELRGQPKVLAWQPNRQTLAIRTADRIHLWNPCTGESPVQVWGEPAPTGIDFARGNALAWSPDGTHLAFGTRTADSVLPRVAKVLSVADRTVVSTLAAGTTPIGTLAWSPDGAHLGVGRGESLARIYEVASGREVLQLVGHGAAVQSMAWHPTGTRIATGSADGAAKVWDADRGRPTVTFEIGSVVRHVAWSPDGAALAAAAEAGTVHVWTGQPSLRPMRGH